MRKVSVIMTSYNKPEYVGKAIEAVLTQSMRDFELLLMDDNSDDKTRKVISEYLGDDRIRFFRSDIDAISERAMKTRYAVLINQALETAKGKYITYATDDNAYRSRRLEIMSDFLDNSNEIKIVYSGSSITYIDRGIVDKTVVRSAKSMTWIAPCQVDHCSVMHRADILPVIYDKWGSYWDEDPAYYLLGDARFFWRLNHFWPFHPIDEILDDNFLTEYSLHTLAREKKADPLISLLPKQGMCRNLRQYLRDLRGDGK